MVIFLYNLDIFVNGHFPIYLDIFVWIQHNRLANTVFTLVMIYIVPVIDSGILSAVTNFCFGYTSPSHRVKYCELSFFKPEKKTTKKQSVSFFSPVKLALL